MKLIASTGRWSCRCGNNHGRFACRVPPAPDVMASLYMEYKRSPQYKKISFAEFLLSIGFTDPSVGMVGMDDEAQFVPTPGGPQKLAIPSQAVVGEVKVKALLVVFPTGRERWTACTTKTFCSRRRNTRPEACATSTGK